MEKCRKSDAVIAEVTDAQKAIAIMNTVNWAFSTPFSIGRSGMPLFDCRKYHWYPATFIPEIPYTLIEVLSNPDAVVYDPFGGIGTTIFQAIQLGRRPFATEVGRIPVEFMRTIWNLMNPVNEISVILNRFEMAKCRYDPIVDYSEKLGKWPTNVELLRPWFSLETFNQISYLAINAFEESNSLVANTLMIALSASLKSLCGQDRGWGCVADNMLPNVDQLSKVKNAFDRVNRVLSMILRDIVKIRSELPLRSCEFLRDNSFDSHVAQVDVRECQHVPDGAVDLIVTSPPYPNMTDYTTSQRLSYYLLGGDLPCDLRKEIGARRRRFSSVSVQQYVNDMQRVMDVLARKLKTGGYACFVMPSFDSKTKNNDIRRQAVQECLAYLMPKGFVLEHELIRMLPTRRRHHNQKWTSLESETISVYRRV